MQKRAQITIFIILGIMIVLGIVYFSLIYSSNSSTNKTEISSECSLFLIEEPVISIIENSLLDSIHILRKASKQVTFLFLKKIIVIITKIILEQKLIYGVKVFLLNWNCL